MKNPTNVSVAGNVSLGWRISRFITDRIQVSEPFTLTDGFSSIQNNKWKSPYGSYSVL